ncbi:MAG: secretin N-terminal domain-containing protein, partial [Phycisphaerae bacterium]
MYTLTNARADDVATNLQAMLDAKVVEKEGARKDAVKVKVLPEPASNRLFVLAPDEYHELAKGLVKMIDTEIDSGEIVRIVHLVNAEAAQLAQTIQARVQSAAKGQPARVNVVADAGSNSIVLSGMPKDVGDAQKLIGDLEEGAATTPELQIFKIVNTSTSNVLDTLEEVFPSEGSKPADKVTIVEDDFYNRLLITTNRRKMRQVEAFVKLLDVRPDADESTDPGMLPGGKELHFVDIGRGDATEIAWDVEEFFPSPSDGGPEIDADWDGEYIKVICRPGEFEKIERLIRQFESRAKPEFTVKTRKLRGDLAKIAPLLSSQIRDLQIEGQPGGTPELPSLIEDLWPEGTEPGSDKGKIKPVSAPGSKKDVQPYLFNPHKLEALAAFDETLSDDAADSAQDAQGDDSAAQEEPATQPEAKPQPPARPARRAVTQPADDKPAAAQPAKAQPATAQPAPAKPVTTPIASPTSQKAPATSVSPLREAARVVQMPDGSISISGEKAQVDAIIDALDVLEEDLEVGQVIRIFRFRFGDVTAAARILEMMFNDRAGAAMNAQMQQMQMMQQMQAQQAQQRGGRNNQGGDEKDDRGGRGGAMDMLSGLMGGGRGAQQPQAGGKSGGQGSTPLRIATDPSHNYLIVKCDESLLPEIRQLLRELDIKPSNVDVKVIQLKNLVATETATNIKEVLGIGRSARGGSRGGAQPNMAAMQGGRNPQQAQLMEIMQAQMVTIPGMEGGDAARIDSVEIVPNDLTNSLLVSAPPEVMKIIERVITDLEKLEDRDILVIRHYPLEKAQVADILPMLQDMFDSAAGGNRATRGGGPGGGGRGGSPTDLGPVTMSGDPRSNSIIYTAQNKDIPLIEAQIKLLDFEGDFAMAESYVVEYGDASAIATTVGEIFGGASGGGGSRRGGGDAGAATGGATNSLRISAEPSTNTIVVWGTLDQRDRVFEKVEELDKLSRRDFREIPVVFADP